MILLESNSDTQAAAPYTRTIAIINYAGYKGLIIQSVLDKEYKL
jgi:hypothetical protein